MSMEDVLNKAASLDEALRNARNPKAPVKKIRVFDFDDTLAKSKSKVIVTLPFLDAKNEMTDVVARRMFREEFKNLPSFKQNFNSLNAEQQKQVLQSIPGETIKINATEFAKQAADLEAAGATFDFTEFSKVVEGKKGPLFEVAKTIQDKRGSEDIFVLTARPQEAAKPIQEFLASIGLNIPLQNITGLADGKPQAKADWMINKFAEGYNDFYFTDDATKNVDAVKAALDVLDVKSKVQVARVKSVSYTHLTLPTSDLV